MGAQTRGWAAPPEPDPRAGGQAAGSQAAGSQRIAGQRAEGLRERKKRLMRQQLSDTATRMFMERGFDDVRVAEVAEACGVSEKTVFNYFPTKESLVLDRLEATVAALRDGLADRQVRPAEAALRILDHELAGLSFWLASQDDPGQAAWEIRRFGDLIRATPSLRAYQSDMMDQFVSVATELLAARAGTSADDPEPQIAARALLGLWHVQADSLRRHLALSPVTAQVRERVGADVRRAARLIDDGLRSFAVSAPSGGTPAGVASGSGNREAGCDGTGGRAGSARRVRGGAG